MCPPDECRKNECYNGSACQNCSEQRTKHTRCCSSQALLIPHRHLHLDSTQLSNAECGSEPKADTSAPARSFLRSLLLSWIRPGSVFKRGPRGCNTHPWPRRHHQVSGRAESTCGRQQNSTGIVRSRAGCSKPGLPIQGGGKQQWDLGRGTHSFLSAASKPLDSCCLLFLLLKEMFWYF